MLYLAGPCCHRGGGSAQAAASTQASPTVQESVPAAAAAAAASAAAALCCHGCSCSCQHLPLLQHCQWHLQPWQHRTLIVKICNSVLGTETFAQLECLLQLAQQFQDVFLAVYKESLQHTLLCLVDFAFFHSS